MKSDDAIIERALATPTELEVKGKKYKISPLNLRTLMEIQRKALRVYKRQVLETYLDTATPAEFEKKREEVVQWTHENLPPKLVIDESSIEVTPELRAKLSAFSPKIPEDDSAVATFAAGLIEQGVATTEELGIKPRKIKTSWALWWATQTFEGACELVLASIQVNHPEVTLDVIQSWETEDVSLASVLAQQETKPVPGNT